MNNTNSNPNVYFGLRKKQKETYDVCVDKKYGVISDTCGSGKSNIEFELICNQILNNQDKPSFIVLAAHRLDLIDQHINNFNNYISTYHPDLVNKYSSFEISSADRSKHNIQNSTNKQDIQRMILGANCPILITCCYYSIERLWSAFYGSRYKVDLMICDEGHFGMSGDTKDKADKCISEYDCISFCNSFLVFTATPFKETMIKTVDEIKIELIHDYSYAEAVMDNVVLPFNANFYVSEKDDKDYSDGSAAGMIATAYENLKEVFKDTSAKLLVCGTGLEKNQLYFKSLIEKYRPEIESGKLAIAKIGSETLTDEEKIIPSSEMVWSENIRPSDNMIPYKIDFQNERDNKSFVMQNMDLWLNNKSPDGSYRNLIIIHCQMLGVGVDIPNINGVCLLGNKDGANLYQSIMRPCRIAYFDRDKSPEDRLEKHFEVYFHVPNDVKDAIHDFIVKIKEIGGISLLDAMTLNNVTGTKGLDAELTASAKEMYNKIVEFQKLEEECNIIFDIEEFETGMKEVEKLTKKYPEHTEYLNTTFSKLVRSKLIVLND